MGYSGNNEPEFIVPTAVAAADDGSGDIRGSGREGISDLDFFTGNEVRSAARAVADSASRSAPSSH